MRGGRNRTAAEAAALARELAAGQVQALAERRRDLDARERHTISILHLVVRSARAALLALSHARDHFLFRVVCEGARARARERVREKREQANPARAPARAHARQSERTRARASSAHAQMVHFPFLQPHMRWQQVRSSVMNREVVVFIFGPNSISLAPVGLGRMKSVWPS